MIDIIVLLAIIISFAIGCYFGIFKTLAKIGSLLIAIGIAYLIANPIASSIYENSIRPDIQNTITHKIEKTGVVDTVDNLYDILQSGKDFNIADYFGDTDETLVNNAIKQTNSKDLKNNLDKLEDENKLTPRNIAVAFADVLAVPMIAIITVIVFGITAVSLNIILNIISYVILKMLYKIDLLNTTQRILGGILSAVITFVICMVAVKTLAYTSFEIVSGSISLNLSTIIPF